MQSDYQSTQPVNAVEGVRTSGMGQMEQIFIHQSILDSIVFELYAIDKTITPSPALSAQLLQIFYEIGQVYGKTVQFELEISFQQNEGELIQLSTAEGIELGNVPAGGLNTTIAFMCTNETVTTPQLAVELNMDIRADLNVSFENFIIYTAANNLAVLNTVVVKDNVGLSYTDYDALLTAVFVSMADDFDLSHSGGMNLVEKFPTLGFISGMARNSIASPYVQNEFIYIGFKWITDFGEALLQQFAQ